MTVLTGALAVAVGLVVSSTGQPLETRVAGVVTNAKTSLTLIYQNNLNASDDKNHIGAIILDPVPQASASAACAAVNERLLSRSALQEYQSDFINALSYQDYADYSDAENGFFIENGTMSVDKQLIFSSTATDSQQQLPVLCTQSANNGSSSASPVNGTQLTVSAQGNTYIGYRNQKSFRFLGIRYANTPERWTYSSLNTQKGQTIQATSYGSQCPQSGTGSEDCLFLNVQTPYIPAANSSAPKLRPVLFWIHGGGFTGGSGADPLTDGGNLASREDIVTVTINYRLSTLGFLAIPGTNITGNYGIADQITALDWTIANIASFGGDPSQITIMGESAGAGSVRALLGSPKAIGKFQGAVAMSNLGGGRTLGLASDYGTSYSSYYTLSDSYAVAGPQIFATAGCNSSSLATQIACLSSVPAESLAAYPTVARYVVQDGTYVNTPNLPLTSASNNTAHIPVIFGNVRDDGSSFSTYPAHPISNHTQGLELALGINSTWASRIIASGLFPLSAAQASTNLTLASFNVSARIATDKTFRCIDQSTAYSGTASAAFAKAYYYQIDRTSGGYDPNALGGPLDDNPDNPYFRFHGGDIPWAFGTLAHLRDADDLYSIQLAVANFASFVRGGDPNPNEEYVRVRGYERVAEGVRRSGVWSAVEGMQGPIRIVDWPARESEFLDVEQCEWLGYGLAYWLDGGM